MSDSAEARWFVMRDLKRHNSKSPAYLVLADKGFEVFTPLKWVISLKNGKKTRKQQPVIAGLLFVKSGKQRLDVEVGKISTLQFRYQLGRPASDPMTVPDREMENFISAVSNSNSPVYYTPGEMRPEMFGREVEIIGGPLDGYTGRLLSMRGSKTRRLIVEIPGFIAAAVEVNPEFIKFI